MSIYLYILFVVEEKSKTDFQEFFFFAVIANGMLEKVASYGLIPNMTLYLKKQYGLGMTTTSNILFYWIAAINFTPVVGAILADSYIGRYNMIGFGSVVSVLVRNI